MKKTIKEEKERILQIMSVISEHDMTYGEERGRLSVERWVWMPLHTFKMHVVDNEMKDDGIDFTLESPSLDDKPHITNVDAIGNYSEEEIEAARQMIQNIIDKVSFPTSLTFDLHDPKDSASLDF